MTHKCGYWCTQYLRESSHGVFWLHTEKVLEVDYLDVTVRNERCCQFDVVICILLLNCSAADRVTGEKLIHLVVMDPSPPPVDVSDKTLNLCQFLCRGP